MEVYIDPDSTFREIVDNIEVIKSRVGDTIASVSLSGIKNTIKFKQELRKQIYDLKFELWKRDKILEVIYDDFPIYKFKKLK